MVEFDWDEANTEHLAEHGVSPYEFEQAMQIDPEDVGFDEVNDEERYRTAGITGSGRLLLMVWTLRGDKIRAITAFAAGPHTRKEWSDRK